MAGFLVLRHRNHDYTTWLPVKSTHASSLSLALNKVYHCSCSLRVFGTLYNQRRWHEVPWTFFKHVHDIRHTMHLGVCDWNNPLES